MSKISALSKNTSIYNNNKMSVDDTIRKTTTKITTKSSSSSTGKTTTSKTNTSTASKTSTTVKTPVSSTASKSKTTNITKNAGTKTNVTDTLVADKKSSTNVSSTSDAKTKSSQKTATQSASTKNTSSTTQKTSAKTETKTTVSGVAGKLGISTKTDPKKTTEKTQVTDTIRIPANTTSSTVAKSNNTTQTTTTTNQNNTKKPTLETIKQSNKVVTGEKVTVTDEIVNDQKSQTSVITKSAVDTSSNQNTTSGTSQNVTLTTQQQGKKTETSEKDATSKATIDAALTNVAEGAVTIATQQGVASGDTQSKSDKDKNDGKADDNHGKDQEENIQDVARKADPEFSQKQVIDISQDFTIGQESLHNIGTITSKYSQFQYDADFMPSVGYKQNDHCNEVLGINRELKFLGFNTDQNNLFSLKTNEAVKAFQMKYQLNISGIVDNQTYNMIHLVYQLQKTVQNSKAYQNDLTEEKIKRIVNEEKGRFANNTASAGNPANQIDEYTRYPTSEELRKMTHPEEEYVAGLGDIISDMPFTGAKVAGGVISYLAHNSEGASTSDDEKVITQGLVEAGTDIAISAATYLAAKGLTKLAEKIKDAVKKSGKVADKVDNAADAAKAADKASNQVDDVASKMDDVGDVGKGGLKSIDTGDLEVIEVKSPDIANKEWLARGYDKPPYSPEFEVKVVKAGNEKYVRVFSYNADGTSNKLGGWLMKESDIKGLNPSQIAEKYALPSQPTHICDVTVNPDFTLQTGIANKVEGWGNGGGQQFDTMGKFIDEDAFVNEREIGN